jgi:hypothetical protein
MRKLNKLIAVIILVFGVQYADAASVFATSKDRPDIPYQPPEQSREELYQDIFISLLLPHIQNKVDQYYSKYLTQTPLVYPYDVHVLSAERPNGYRTFLFQVKLQFYSYIGPHNPVGLDSLAVTVGGPGDVTIGGFEHIKSYALPPNYEHIIRKGYKNPIP